MQTEFEAKFFPINKQVMRNKLQEIGARKVHDEICMKRCVYHLGDKSIRKWLRIRDEGDRTTITIKEVVNENSIDGVKEVEIEANDFKKTCDLFLSKGMVPDVYQENYREKWELDGGTITIDTWPGLEPVLEVEGESVQHVEELCKKMNLNLSDALFGAVDVLYGKRYGLSPAELNSIADLSFARFNECGKRLFEVKLQTKA